MTNLDQSLAEQKLRELLLFIIRPAEGEEIPYSTALLGRPRPPTPAEVKHRRHFI